MEYPHDPRDRLVREKFFSLRPKPLERWIWQQGLPPAAERVFWQHWEEGMRNRTWCSEIPIRRVAALCCVDVSTVSRAYQLLRSRGLIRREDPGRDPANPFQQATAITEVRVPRELLIELERHPSRSQPRRSPQPDRLQSVPTKAVSEEGLAAPAVAVPRSRAEIHGILNKLSDAERREFFHASREGIATLRFDEATKLAADERGLLLRQLELASLARNRPPQPAKSAHQPANGVAPQRLSPLELARARRSILATVPTAQQAAETLRQLIWAVEEGALRRFGALKAMNIGLKKIREGAWSRPNRMPPNWLRGREVPEICTAA
jgi:hypothetical protein